jgi:hypothetical protein
METVPGESAWEIKSEVAYGLLLPNGNRVGLYSDEYDGTEYSILVDTWGREGREAYPAYETQSLTEISTVLALLDDPHTTVACGMRWNRGVASSSTEITVLRIEREVRQRVEAAPDVSAIVRLKRLENTRRVPSRVAASYFRRGAFDREGTVTLAIVSRPEGLDPAMLDDLGGVIHLDKWGYHEEMILLGAREVPPEVSDRGDEAMLVVLSERKPGDGDKPVMIHQVTRKPFPPMSRP